MSGLDNVLGVLDPGDFLGTKRGREGQESAKRTQEMQLGELARQFDVTTESLRPSLEEAQPAFELQSALSGAQGPEAQAQAMAGLQLDPGSQFATQQGLRLIESGGGATGGLGGGDRLRQLAEYGSDIARQGLANRASQLGVVSGTGQAAGSGLAGIGSRYARDVSGVTAQGAQNQIDALQSAQQQRASTVSTGLGALAMLSDKNKKHDIKDLSPEECFDIISNTPIKAWKYLEEVGVGQDTHFGPMAQDAPDIIKIEGKEALSLHDELWLIAGAVKYLGGVKND